MEPIYDLVDLTTEESSAFMAEFQTLLLTSSVYFEPVPIYTRTAVGEPWKLECQIMLKKKVRKEAPAAEPTPEVTQTDESAQATA